MEGNHANPFRLVFDSIICRVLYIPGGAGFLSSTGFTLLKTHWNKSRRFPHRPINGDQMLIDPFGRNENITLNTSKQSMTLCKISQGSWVALGHWKKPKHRDEPSNYFEILWQTLRGFSQPRMIRSWWSKTPAENYQFESSETQLAHKKWGKFLQYQSQRIHVVDLPPFGWCLW